MRAYEENNNIIIADAEDFDLTQTFECGQCFRWEKCGDAYEGVAFGRALRIFRDKGNIVLCDTDFSDWESIWKNYFDLSRCYGDIKNTLATDSVMKSATEFGGGIRILAQEPFECLISFIISASNNIPRIKKIIAALCENFGEKISYQGKCYFAFPTAERLASLSLSDLSVIKAGFRDKYILSAAKAVHSGELDLDFLKVSSPEYAKSELLKLPGVGNKVADCVSLFSLGKYSSFPVDVWIKRIMEYCFFDSEQSKDVISDYAAKKFGELGGFAQQYLFYWARENKIGI